MGRTLRRHPQALVDVEESAAYLGKASPQAALRFLGAVETTLRLLVDRPELGPSRRIAHGELADLRWLPVRGFDSHLVFYRPSNRGIEIVRGLHGSRDLGAALEELD
ncbi:MAG: type II toxin-antitoxin system RelE/ParE family toxin [Planctomycetota bacterium]